MKINEFGMEVEESSKDPATLKLVVPFNTAREASIAYNTLVVDKEPKRNQCKKELSVEDKNLILSLSAPEPRQLRMSANSFFDHLSLVRKTIDEFDPLLREKGPKEPRLEQ